MIKNTTQCYGSIAIIFHWLSVLLILVIFSLGVWLSELSYYDAYYKTIPLWHKSLGVIFFLVAALRLLWRFINPAPGFEPTISRQEQIIARGVHYLFYCLMLLIPLSGYAVATSEGQAVEVFNWFAIPAVIEFDNSSDSVSKVHAFLAWLLLVLAMVHTAAALKHHCIDKDHTLLKMLGIKKKENTCD